MVHDLRQAVALVGDDTGHIGPKHRVDQKDRSDDHQGRPQRAARGLKQEHQANYGDHEILKDRGTDAT